MTTKLPTPEERAKQPLYGLSALFETELETRSRLITEDRAQILALLEELTDRAFREVEAYGTPTGNYVRKSDVVLFIAKIKNELCKELRGTE